MIHINLNRAEADSLARSRARHARSQRAWRERNADTEREYRRSRRASEAGEAVRAYHRAWVEQNMSRRLLYIARNRAREIGVPFDLTEADVVIPERCPVLGVKIERHTAGAPTLDRMVPHLGYVRGNVTVISRRANVIKNDGTAEEHERVAAWMREREAGR